MIIKENNNLRDEIFAFLDETGGYTDYNQKIEDVSEEFGLSEDEAENFVWSWASNSDLDLEESYDSDYTVHYGDRITAKNFRELIDKLEAHGYSCEHYYDIDYPDSNWLYIIKDGDSYEAEFYKYRDGEYELYLHNIRPTKEKSYNESYDSDYTYEDKYEYIKSKTVLDSDGFTTDYTMYYDNEDDKYIFIYGDADIYDPYNSDPDWECETEREANEWFNSYNEYDDSYQFDDYRYYDGLDEKLSIREAEQKYNSAITSINSGKLPAVFSKVRFEPNTINLDYGGGKFDNVAEYLKDKYNVTNLVYDKYNRSSGHNSDVLKQVKENGGADTVTCSNVLNVIAEPEIRQEVLRDCKKYLKPNGTCYITVYEGNGSGEGKANDKRQSYQTNMKLDDYIDEVSKVFSNVKEK